MNAITNVVGQSLEDGARVARLKKAVDEATYGGCIERAVLWSEYYMDEANDGKSTAVQIAEATRHVLANKTVKYQGEAVAAVAAETAEIAQEACDLIEVVYEELPAVTNATL